MIVEDLSRENYALLQTAKHHPCVESAWSLRGTIYVRLEGGYTLPVSCATDIETALEERRDTASGDTFGASMSTPLPHAVYRQ